MATVETTDTPRTARQLIAELERLRGAPCADCGGAICSHEALMSIAMGFRNAPRCLRCLARALAQEPAPLADQLHRYLQRQECHRTAWEWANTAEGFDVARRPGCLFPDDATPAGPFSEDAEDFDEADAATTEPTVGEISSTQLTRAADWDAGDRACGELVLELRLRLEARPPGNVFKLCARDTAVPLDLPAWCRLTGHRLRRAEPPHYWIQRKE